MNKIWRITTKFGTYLCKNFETDDGVLFVSRAIQINEWQSIYPKIHEYFIRDEVYFSQPYIIYQIERADNFEEIYRSIGQ